MKHLKTVLLVTAMIIAFAMDAFPQLTVIGQSSEWEATAFNNGRRVVRDCSMAGTGYYHYVWHSRNNPARPPIGRNCDIYYACTDEIGNPIIGPVNLTGRFGFEDNRYPSIAIENFALDAAGNWLTFNTLHVVWQCKQAPLANYEIMYGAIPVGNPPAPDPLPAPAASLINVKNLSQTPARDSLVPAVEINRYDLLGPGFQHIHVVWQEENVAHAVGGFASDIFYTRSIDSGLNFNGPVSGLLWDNITNSPFHSQMPSIACSIDTFQGFPIVYTGDDCYYRSNNVHVAYNENTLGGGVHVYYLQSPVDGAGWALPQDITMVMGGVAATCDGYPNISCDMRDNAHIVFMRNVAPHSPIAGYQAGRNPALVASFPGPDPGMYNGLLNNIVYWSSNPGAVALPALPVGFDREFPTVALDRGQNVSINWQECQVFAGGGVGDYEVMRDSCFNLIAPTRPVQVPVYGAWAAFPNNDSANAINEDLFPNLAHKKESMYLISVPPFPGFTEIWNKVFGLGSGACTAANPKNINMYSNAARDGAVN